MQKSGIIFANVNELMAYLFKVSATGHVSRYGRDLVASFKFNVGEAIRFCRGKDPFEGTCIEIHRDKATSRSAGHTPNALLVLSVALDKVEGEVEDVKKGTLYKQELVIEFPEDIITLVARSHTPFLNEVLRLAESLPSNHVWENEILEWKALDKAVFREKPRVLPTASSGTVVA